MRKILLISYIFMLLVLPIGYIKVSPEAIQNRFFWKPTHLTKFVNFGVSAAYDLDTHKIKYFAFIFANW